MISIPVPLSPVANRLVALLSATTALLGLGLAGPAAGLDDEPRILAVQFHLAAPAIDDDAGPLRAAAAEDIAHYAGFQIGHGGVTRRLRPLAGPVTVAPVAGTGALAVDIDGLRIGSAAGEFDASLAKAFASASLSQFARIDTEGIGDPATIDLRLSRALRAGDYILVQDAGGDDEIELQGIGTDGVTTGSTQVVGPPYRWNSGHRAADGAAHWATVIEAPTSADGGPVVGLRIRAAQADVKVLVLESAEGSGPVSATASPAPTATPTSAAATPPSTPTTVAPTTPPTALEMPSPEEPSTASRSEPTASEPASTEPTASEPASTEPIPTEPVSAESVDESADHPAEPASLVDQPMAVPVPTHEPQGAQLDATRPAPTALAMTGMPTEPWILVGLATGFIFFGYTTVAAFRRPKHLPGPGEPRGHSQLDALGFE